jgi:hypothetical protein
MTETGHQLVNYDAMCIAINAAYEIDEVKEIRDKATALELYMRQIGNTESEDRCYQIRMRAQRKAGEISKNLEKAQGARRDIATSPGNREKSKILADAGIPSQRASEWERLSEVSDDQFEAAFATNKRPSICYKQTPVH